MINKLQSFWVWRERRKCFLCLPNPYQICVLALALAKPLSSVKRKGRGKTKIQSLTLFCTVHLQSQFQFYGQFILDDQFLFAVYARLIWPALYSCSLYLWPTSDLPFLNSETAPNRTKPHQIALSSSRVPQVITIIILLDCWARFRVEATWHQRWWYVHWRCHLGRCHHHRRVTNGRENSRSTDLHATRSCTLRPWIYLCFRLVMVNITRDRKRRREYDDSDDQKCEKDEEVHSVLPPETMPGTGSGSLSVGWRGG